MITMATGNCHEEFIKKKLFPFTTVIGLFIVLIAVSALLALIGGGVGVDNFKKVEKTFEPDLDKKIERYGRFGGTMKDVDDLQKKYKCCGVYTYADWRITVWGGHRYDKVPDACCKSETYGCGYIFRDADKTLNKKGCASIVVGDVRVNLATVGVIGIIFGIVEMILWAAFLYCYCCKGGGENYAQSQSPTQSNVGEHELLGSKGGTSSGQSKVGPTSAREENVGQEDVGQEDDGQRYVGQQDFRQEESTSNPGASSKKEGGGPSDEKVTYC